MYQKERVLQRPVKQLLTSPGPRQPVRSQLDRDGLQVTASSAFFKAGKPELRPALRLRAGRWELTAAAVSVPTEAEGSGSLQEHAEDHPPSSGRGGQEVPERLGQGGIQEEQERHQPGSSDC